MSVLVYLNSIAFVQWREIVTCIDRRKLYIITNINLDVMHYKLVHSHDKRDTSHVTLASRRRERERERERESVGSMRVREQGESEIS